VIAVGTRKVMVVVVVATTPFRAQKQSMQSTVTLFGNHLIHAVTM
jgi:hypothetical protein